MLGRRALPSGRRARDLFHDPLGRDTKLPETVVLPLRILPTVSMGTSGMALTWDLVLKPIRALEDERGQTLLETASLAIDGRFHENDHFL